MHSGCGKVEGQQQSLFCWCCLQVCTKLHEDAELIAYLQEEIGKSSVEEGNDLERLVLNLRLLPA